MEILSTFPKLTTKLITVDSIIDKQFIRLSQLFESEPKSHQMQMLILNQLDLNLTFLKTLSLKCDFPKKNVLKGKVVEQKRDTTTN